MTKPTNTEPEIKTAYIYCYSAIATQSDRDDTLRSQENACRSHAEKLGFKVIRCFKDRGERQSSNRNGLTELLTAIEDSEITPQAVITIDRSRISRDLATYCGLRDKITAADACLEFVDGSIDAGSPEDQLASSIMLATDQLLEAKDASDA